MTTLDDLIGTALDVIAKRCAAEGFEAVRDAIDAWGNDRADESAEGLAPGWHELMAFAFRRALELCEAAGDRRDECQIAITFSEDGGGMVFQFPAAGAGDTLAPVIRRAVEGAICPPATEDTP